MVASPSLWLIIPAWRRYDVTRVSFPQLAQCCETLRADYDINAQAVVIAEDDNLGIAKQHGFHTLEAANQPLGKKWNDGYQYALEHDADYLVPCGTDDWVDPAYLAQLPKQRQVRASRWSSAVREDGKKLLQFNVDYEGGDGIRIIPADMIRKCGGRPADDRKERAIDTSVWMTLRRKVGSFTFVYSNDPLAIVQFQSVEPQLNVYAALRKRFRCRELEDPMSVLRTRFADRFVCGAEALYAERTA